MRNSRSADIVDVAARVELPVARRLFRRHEAGDPGEGAFLRQPGIVAGQARSFSRAEVAQLGHVVHLAALAGKMLLG